ncbi:helix-turn-helix transcriptional regulator [Nocardioides sp. SLBN-35]|uniref:helix-turn-helix domain-containing protein n=1 Tax=Nocardioides sp. SLBN-35 TaxID=2768445 RepID=UPI0011538A71|nr:helix-turn-helix transcriptional regulator [Nocardioides sp. SLBN-35]TQK68270.1 hypothetical protein FBY23_0016 [Nocardioides sp. SLBN-35]
MTDSQISDFSRRFSAALQGVMRENKVRVVDVVEKLGKSKGFVSEHTNGTKAPNTDLLDAIAELMGIDTRDLVREIVRRIPDPAPAAEVRQLRRDQPRADFVFRDVVADDEEEIAAHDSEGTIEEEQHAPEFP